MVKLIGAVLILFAGTMIGFQQASRFAARPRQIRQLIHALQRLETEIGYGYTPLPEAMSNTAIHLPEPIKSMFHEVCRLLAQDNELSFRECWEQAVVKHWPSTAMKSAERSALIRLGTSLGISDRDDQIKHLKLAETQLGAEEEAARDEQARYEKMSRSLGVLVAALVVILIV
ncbi:stage III sporulation protein AB [Paenibacillus phyllosphaerae]|uniref:Stage III sporulation protein AB n=1 Tax=Paenibacillus phyllosphaerae TaxID=274593 RepID=A0A7W5AUS4_9BACL|nr:stage III sporulation protein SpoIIIAB [Paenibacillus phyllosphaerae]MBB3109170.1 stage III sporulation protein AB [Paenibacillus phyllosphaerae]